MLTVLPGRSDRLQIGSLPKIRPRSDAIGVGPNLLAIVPVELGRLDLAANFLHQIAQGATGNVDRHLFANGPVEERLSHG